jgi:hypothetical protein
LERRELLATLTNGNGDGQLFVQVNEQGAFGNANTLAVNLANPPQGNTVDDALFNPPGARGQAGTTYESGLAIRLLGGTTRQFLTAGTIGGTGNNQSGFFFDASVGLPQNNLERNSRFFWPNNVTRPSGGNQVPAGAQLQFDLRQTLVDLTFSGAQDGTALVQQYTVTNVSGNTLSFELIRYWDGDIFAGGSPLLDGGGRRIFDVRRGVDGVFQSDVANNNPAQDPTFIEIQSSLDNVPRTQRWEVGLAGNVLPVKPAGPLLQAIIAGTALADDVTPAAADADANNIRDVGADADVAVALRQEFVDLPNNQQVVFISTTVFGHPPQTAVNPPPPPPAAGSASGVKYLDRNANGVRDPGEPGVPGFTIFADVNQNGVRDSAEQFAITDANGAFTINVPVGTTQVREEQQPDWTQTGPLTGFNLAVITAAGMAVVDLDFGNVPDPGEIRGVKFNDDNGNGSQGAGEAGIAGVTIFLDANDDGVLDTGEVRTTTDAQGNYVFPNLEPATYVVREIVPNGFDQTAPGGDGAYRITLLPGQVVVGADFGNRLRRGSIEGVKWNDLNGDGVRQTGEPGVGGIIIYIDQNRDGRFNFGERAAVTDSQGRYQIVDLLPGEYVVREIAPPGTIPTFPAAGFHQKLVFAGFPTVDVDFGNRASFDFGDAPATYGTLLPDGARHGIIPGFHLGARIDGEPNGRPSPDATGDDRDGGGFGAPVNFAVGDQPSDLLLIDVSGDDIPDLITANRGSDDVSVSFGNGDGSFGPALELAVGAEPVGVFAADYDGDGLLDLAVAHAAEAEVSILINMGGGVFDEAESFPAGGVQSDIVAFDHDGDGDADIFVTRPGTNDLVVLPNVTNGVLDFGPVIAANTYPVGTNPVRLRFGRINGDALQDLVVVNRGSDSVSVLRNLGNGAFAFPVSYVVGNDPNDVAIADFDGDGLRDLAVANETSRSVTVLYNNGFGVFPNNTNLTFPVPGAPVAITAGNFDGQPGIDLAVALQATNSVAVLSNDGAGNFPAAAVFPTALGPAAIATTDLDGDNVADIITANFGSDRVSVLQIEEGDEDGVRFAGPLAANRLTGVAVTATAAGVLNAWIDFDRSGVFDADERVFADTAVTAGVNQLFITTPAGTTDGNVFARFRFSALRGLAPTGLAASGEVEDYLVEVDSTAGGPNTGHTNLADPEDVDASGVVELFDVLLLVNDLRANGGPHALPPVNNPPPPPPFLDVNGNGLVELNDVLRVIHRMLLDDAIGANPEGEAALDEGASGDLDGGLESTLDNIAPDVCRVWGDE